MLCNGRNRSALWMDDSRFAQTEMVHYETILALNISLMLYYNP